MDIQVGSTGLAVLAMLLVVLLIEDVFVWLNGGAIQGFEFFLVSAALVVLVYLVIRAVRSSRVKRLD